MKIRGKIILNISLLVAVLVIAVGSLAIIKARGAVYNELKKRAFLLLDFSWTRRRAPNKDKLMLGAVLESLVKNDKSVEYAVVLNNSGKVIAHSNPNILPGSSFDETGEYAKMESNEENILEKGENVLESITPIVVENKKTGIALVWVSKETLFETELNLSIYILVVLVAAVALGILIAFMMGTVTSAEEKSKDNRSDKEGRGGLGRRTRPRRGACATLR